MPFSAAVLSAFLLSFLRNHAGEPAVSCGSELLEFLGAVGDGVAIVLFLLPLPSDGIFFFSALPPLFRFSFFIRSSNAVATGKAAGDVCIIRLSVV